MKRFVLAVLVLLLAFGGFATSAQAPEGTYLGTWPYVLPPDHHLNSVASGGLNTNLGTVYRGIVELAPAHYMWATNEYVPVLAESWGFADDGSYFEFTLKSGATWSNGDPITSNDVVTTYAIGRILNWSQFNYINDVQAVDDLTTRFIFTSAPSLLLERLVLKEYIIASANYGELAEKALALIADGKTRDDQEWKDLAAEINAFRPEELIASGPYTYTLADVGDAFMTLRWQPNSLYSGTVNFGEVKLWAGETEVTAPLVLSGELAHSTNVYPPATMSAFVDQGINVIEIPRGYGPALLFKFGVAPLDIKEVRQAMAYAIERNQNAFLTNGIGATPSTCMCGLLNDSAKVLLSEETLAALNPYEYNVETAAALMEQAGFTRNDAGKWVDADGNTIALEYKFPADFADFSAASQDAINQLNDFGFDITAVALPWQEAAAAIRAGDFELSVWSYASGSPFATSQFFGPIQRFNYVGLADDQRGMDFAMQFEYNGEQIDLDQMIKDASAGLDAEQQMATADKIATIINDLMPYIPLNEMISVEPFNTTLVAGVPEPGDPALANPTGSDHFAILWLLEGKLSPAN